MSTSKAAVVASALMGKVASIVGYIFGIFSLMIIIVGITDLDSPGAFVAVVFLLGVLAVSVFLIVRGIKIKRRIKRFKQYISLISGAGMTSVARIAGATTHSVDFVINDLQRMIDKKFFANATIDYQSGEILIGGRAPGAAAVAQQVVTAEYEYVSCSGCGANNSKQKGLPDTCDYCGSPI